MNVRKSSGCFVAIRTLMDSLRTQDVQVDLVTPRLHLPVFALERILFNKTVATDGPWDATVGFDVDGYAVAGRSRKLHVAAIKGVLADAVPFEHGVTRASMALQASLEKQHAQRADLVITISQYCADRIAELYGVRERVVVVPELIDLAAWDALFRENPAEQVADEFTVLCVCRFYPRKNMALLLQATAMLKQKMPEMRLRIVGNGPQATMLRTLARSLGIEDRVTFVGDAKRAALAQEYNRADVFCLPSLQEGFGIVFLEAMAAGKPIIAVRAGAAPEVVKHGVLVEPGNAEALAEGIMRLGRDADLRAELGRLGKLDVERYRANRVAGEFLRMIQAAR